MEHVSPPTDTPVICQPPEHPSNGTADAAPPPQHPPPAPAEEPSAKRLRRETTRAFEQASREFLAKDLQQTLAHLDRLLTLIGTEKTAVQVMEELENLVNKHYAPKKRFLFERTELRIRLEPSGDEGDEQPTYRDAATWITTCSAPPTQPLTD